MSLGSPELAGRVFSLSLLGSPTDVEDRLFIHECINDSDCSEVSKEVQGSTGERITDSIWGNQGSSVESDFQMQEGISFFFFFFFFFEMSNFIF